MKTTIHSIPTMSLEDFADQHNLEMVVHERKNPSSLMSRFYAYFEGVEVKDGRILASVYGDGETPEKAISHYAPQISGKRIVVNACKSNRREIEVPYLS